MIRSSSTRTATVGLVGALLAGSVALSAPAGAAPADTTAPTVADAVSFSPATVDVTRGDAESTVSVKLADDSSGVADATLYLVDPKGNQASVDLERTAGSAASGTWTGVQSFSSFDYTGRWTPSSLYAIDASNNSTTITGSALGTAGVTVSRTDDTVDPTLIGASTTVTAVDTTAGPVDAVVRVSASDDLSGVESGVVTFSSRDGDIAEGYLSGEPVTGNSLNGSWDVPVTFPARSAAGVWRLSSISLADAQYNTDDFDSEDAELPSMPIKVVTADDTAGPTLSSFTVGPPKRSTAYGRDGDVVTQVGFTDAISGVDTVEVTLQRPDVAGKPGPSEEPEIVAFADTDLKTGTSRNGTITVPIFVEGFNAGVWKIASVVLTDLAGNRTVVATAKLPGSRTTFEVSTTAGTDTSAPTAGGYTFSPETLDTRTGPQSGSVLIAAADPDAVPAGIVGGEATLTSPTGTQTATATFVTATDLVSGDQANGTFRAGFTLPQNAEDGAWTVTSVKVTDGARNAGVVTAFSSTPTLTVLGQGRAPATAPDAPVIGTASIDKTTAIVTWSVPASDGGARITGYVVTAYRNGVPAGSYNAPGTSATVPSLLRGQSYTFTVAARNAAGTGTPSAASNAVTVPAAAPGAPTIRPATLADTTATVTWDAPADTGGAAITGYVVTPYLGSAKQPVVRVGDVRSTTIDDLALGRTYSFRVAATNSVGDGTPSQASNTVSVAPTVPAAPRVSSARVAGTSATVAWETPYDGGAPITGYRVVGSPAGSCSTTGTSCVVTGLTPDQSYSFTVTATNGVGRGADSAPSPTVVAARPRPTTLTLATLPSLVRAGTTVTVGGRVTETGTAAGVQGQRVRLQYRTGSGGWTTSPTVATTGRDGSARIGLRPARTVQVRLVSQLTDAFTAATSGARTVAVGRTLTLASKSVRVKRGKKVTLAGRATPVRPGGVVTLQRRIGYRWTKVASKRVNGSTYSFTVRSTKRGSVAYRVITAGDAAYATSVSNVRTLRVR